MDCETYNLNLYIKLLISLGKNEEIISSPSLLEYHLHREACEKHNTEYKEHLAKSKFSPGDSEAFERGLGRIKRELWGMIE